MRRGFITIATGKDTYYELAKNLLNSYRKFCEEQLPFAILCDRENEYTEQFDEVILFKDGATNSYLDKLSLGEYLPYEETIFIDADCLAFDDLNALFGYFEKADDFSCFGRILPLDDQTGWFEYENLGDLKSQVSYVVGLHGGIYYMRRTDLTRKVFEDAKRFVPDYPKYKFKGKFLTPGDEPLIALSMAVNQCHPEPFRTEAIFCYWENVEGIKIDITEGKAFIGDGDTSTRLLHWGTRFTKEYEYQRQVELLDIMQSDQDKKDIIIRKCVKKYNRKIRNKKIIDFIKRVINKIRRTLKLG